MGENEKLFDGRYKLLKTLSTDGGTADVWLAIDVNTIDNPDLLGEEAENLSPEERGMLVAIKIYRPKNALDIEGEQRFRDEYKIVHNCRHTNLLQPNNFSICGDTPYLELPYCKNGSSELLIGKILAEKDIWKFIYDVASGLSYLHACSPQIIHQDIKPANVLIDDYNNYAITDFGISSHRGGKSGFYYDEDNSGTMAYMAPERFRDDYKPIAESDIWAFGATLYEILAGKVPFGEEGGKFQLENKLKLKSMGKHTPKDVQKLIFSCLSLKTKERPTANQIINIAEKHLNTTNKVVKYSSIAIALVLAVWGISHFFSHKPMPIEEAFQNALVMLNSESPTEVKRGVDIMDSLSTYDYAPAMWELAKTYGWFSDTVLLKRKDALGIKYNKESGKKGMPELDKYNYKTINLYSKIIELDNSTITTIKAQAAYRMATYYANENGVYKLNLSKALQYLLQAEKYAIEIKDDSLLLNINKAISKTEQEIKENK